jgi:hypothetical protein
MAQLTRSNLLAVTVKRFLTQVLRHDPAAHAALPEDLVQRYAPAEGRIIGYGQSKADKEALVRRVQQTAGDRKPNREFPRWAGMEAPGRISKVKPAGLVAMETS